MQVILARNSIYIILSSKTCLQLHISNGLSVSITIPSIMSAFFHCLLYLRQYNKVTIMIYKIGFGVLQSGCNQRDSCNLPYCMLTHAASLLC
jgi:hypothetical protein